MQLFIQRYKAVILLLILCFAFFSRMYRLNIPERYIFDEVYHAVTAKLIARNDPRAYEWWNEPPEVNTAVDWLHPPLAKYTQALSILAFGENSFGWRFSSVVFGVLVILMTYHLAQKLFKNDSIALLSAFIASLDGLLLVQSRIAMNDIHVTFFILAALYCYLEYRKEIELKNLLIAGFVAGLAMASKWSGLFALVSIWFFEGLTFLSSLSYAIADTKSKIGSIISFAAGFAITRIILVVAIPVAVYIAGYSHMFLQGKDWAHFRELHNQIWWYQTHLDATHPYQSRPYQWVLDLRPVWVDVQYFPEVDQRADIYSFGNPIIFWFGAVCVGLSIIYLAVQAKQYLSSLNKNARFSAKLAEVFGELSANSLFFLLVAYLLVWLPWQISPRIMFFYHYTPAVPLLAIFIGYWMQKITTITKIIPVTLLVLMVVCFLIWYPHWTGLPVSTAFADKIYFFLPSWK